MASLTLRTVTQVLSMEDPVQSECLGLLVVTTGGNPGSFRFPLSSPDFQAKSYHLIFAFVF